MNIRPLHDRIVVKRLEEDDAKVGTLFVPDSAKEKPHKGEVIAVGKGKRNEKGDLIPMEVKVGDIISFGKYSGSDFKEDGVEYLTMREDEVYFVHEGASKNAKA